MSLALYSTPSSQATPRPQRLFKTRRNGRAWTMAVRAIRAVITIGRECAPSQAPSAEQLADIVIDNISRLDSRSRMVLAIVLAELVLTSNN
jgi:hypothetical protein